MNYFDIFLFTVKYTPFWAVPIGVIHANFAYVYWLKDYRELAAVCAIITLFCLTSITIYLIMGGPDQITNTITHVFQ
jgi:ABC-type Fe3+ transport system permease subunit